MKPQKHFIVLNRYVGNGQTQNLVLSKSNEGGAEREYRHSFFKSEQKLGEFINELKINGFIERTKL